MSVPAIRIRTRNDQPVRRQGAIVLYWMIAARRARHSFALDRAIEHASALGLPLVVLEPLRADYPFANDRLHRFVLEGMAENARRFHGAPALYHPYVEPTIGAGRGLVEALAAQAAVVVTDDWPASFLPRMVDAFAARAPVLVEAVDGNGLYPVRAAERVFTTAASFRRHLQKTLREHLAHRPRPEPFAGVELPRLEALPARIGARWPAASSELLTGAREQLAMLPIDHSVAPAPARGGSGAAEQALARFVSEKLRRYAAERDHPDEDAGSGLSPWLHFGHISAHQIFEAVTARVRWRVEKLATVAHGGRERWWNAGPDVEAFLDQLVTWRELGFNMCALRADHASWATLPSFARQTLEQHARDRRPHLYSRAELEEARTHDRIWNAAQRELVREGRMHNYLRMLWGKKVLEWSRAPEEALETMLYLNDKYALDGRDPSSISGIFWVLGRYDRAWGPEREIFGKVRFMSSANTARKVRLRRYLERYGA
jgi:deoxyribodipyrimidine photo-lyase